MSEPALVLAVDVGNSRVKFGLFQSSCDRATAQGQEGLPQCIEFLAVAHGERIPWNIISQWNAASPPETATVSIIAGPNPTVVEQLCEEWPTALHSSVKLVTSAAELNLKINVDEPQKVGIDRLLNAIAANHIRKPDQATIIVDAGTATTVDLVSSDGAFEGGAILPGIELAARSLNQYTALLPLVQLDELASQQAESPDDATVPALGKNTRAAITSGLFWGHVGAVRELVRQYQMSLPQENLPILLTGGGGAVLRRTFPQARYEPYLALQGLVLATDHTDR